VTRERGSGGDDNPEEGKATEKRGLDMHGKMGLRIRTSGDGVGQSCPQTRTHGKRGQY